MNNIDTLRNIAQYLGLNDVVEDIDIIDSRAKQPNANLVLPLIGEFSSGKTTLLNSLMDCKKLETATKPTTATVYEVHFGCEESYANITYDNGDIYQVDNLDDLKNDELTDASVVTVFDTSTRVPSSTILVDTPGLSSIDPRHKQTLVDFLPKADGVLLVIDINQQMTRSLSDFIESTKLLKLPIYLILTKADTKSQQEIEAVKQYASDNYQIPIRQVAVVSAATGDLRELYSLMETIQNDKNEIMSKVDEQRIKAIADTLLERISDFEEASVSYEDLDDTIMRNENELNRINKDIDRFIESLSDDIEEQKIIVSRKFEEIIYAKLNTLVAGKSDDFDQAAVTEINNTASLVMEEFRSNIYTALQKKASAQGSAASDSPTLSAEDVDLSYIQIPSLSYYLDLNTMGHEYDQWIKTGVIAAATVGAVVAVVSSGGSAGAAVAGAAGVDTAISVADTATDVGSMVVARRSMRRIERAANLVNNATYKYRKISEQDERMGRRMGQKKGIIESMVGFVSENLMSKPQRVKAIHGYINASLAPEFKASLERASQDLINAVRNNLRDNVALLIQQKTDYLNQLKAELAHSEEAYNQRRQQLSEYKATLLAM